METAEEMSSFSKHLEGCTVLRKRSCRFVRERLCQSSVYCMIKALLDSRESGDSLHAQVMYNFSILFHNTNLQLGSASQCFAATPEWSSMRCSPRSSTWIGKYAEYMHYLCTLLTASGRCCE